MSDKVLLFRSPTYTARLFSSKCGAGRFLISGTLDGFVDLAMPEGGTYQLNLDAANSLAEALKGAIADIKANCRYDDDSLLGPAND